MSFTRKGTFPAQPVTVRGQAVHLGVDPKGVNFLYTNGRAVIIRNLENPDIAKEYTQHAAPATVARYSPSGFYIASGDANGNIRIWDTTQAENILKLETKIISGKITDLAWDHESKRIIAVGEGRDRFGHAFLFDSGSSCGEITGHAKTINSVSVRQSRPFRAVTASDDMTVNFYHGTPYKYNLTIKDHTRFVQCVRFSPTGDLFCSAGMDAKVFLYDGKTGEKKTELTKVADSHAGGIFSVSWSPDGTKMITGSADTTVKLWDVAAEKVISTFQTTSNVHYDFQQVGTLWSGSNILSLSLNGDLNYFSETTGGISRSVKGHQRAITALTCDVKSKTLYSGSYDGRVFGWNVGEFDAPAKTSGGGVPVEGGHTNQVSGLSTDNGTVVSVGYDDTLRSFKVGDSSFSANVISTGSLPTSVSSNNGVSVSVTKNQEIVLLTPNSTSPSVTRVSWTPTVAAVSPSGNELAVGSEEAKIYIFSISGTSLTQTHILENNRGSITTIAYSPNGELLAVGDSERCIMCYDITNKTVRITQWMFHTSKITTLAWSPDSLHCASGSLDTNVEIWSVVAPTKHVAIKGAHLDCVNQVVWSDNDTVVSAGQDASIKLNFVSNVVAKVMRTTCRLDDYGLRRDSKKQTVDIVLAVPSRYLRTNPYSELMTGHDLGERDYWQTPIVLFTEFQEILNSVLPNLSKVREISTLSYLQLGDLQIPLYYTSVTLLFWKPGTYEVGELRRKCLENRITAIVGSSGCGKTRSIFDVLSQVFGLYFTHKDMNIPGSWDLSIALSRMKSESYLPVFVDEAQILISKHEDCFYSSETQQTKLQYYAFAVAITKIDGCSFIACGTDLRLLEINEEFQTSTEPHGNIKHIVSNVFESPVQIIDYMQQCKPFLDCYGTEEVVWLLGRVRLLTSFVEVQLKRIFEQKSLGFSTNSFLLDSVKIFIQRITSRAHTLSQFKLHYMFDKERYREEYAEVLQPAFCITYILESRELIIRVDEPFMMRAVLDFVVEVGVNWRTLFGYPIKLLESDLESRILYSFEDASQNIPFRNYLARRIMDICENDYRLLFGTQRDQLSANGFLYISNKSRLFSNEPGYLVFFLEIDEKLMPVFVKLKLRTELSYESGLQATNPSFFYMDPATVKHNSDTDQERMNVDKEMRAFTWHLGILIAYPERSEIPNVCSYKNGRFEHIFEGNNLKEILDDHSKLLDYLKSLN
ncbi:WD repeat-containing protein 1 [Nowakowskiella sp. JEL0407]|nr:WD repeat-containing protein 1 [Nowakowskiella sp. JEL0407]